MLALQCQVFLFCSFLCSPKEMNQRKGDFFGGIFPPPANRRAEENHSWLAKFPPGLRKFLTPISYYPAKKFKNKRQCIGLIFYWTSFWFRRKTRSGITWDEMVTREKGSDPRVRSWDQRANDPATARIAEVIHGRSFQGMKTQSWFFAAFLSRKKQGPPGLRAKSVIE